MASTLSGKLMFSNELQRLNAYAEIDFRFVGNVTDAKPVHPENRL